MTNMINAQRIKIDATEHEKKVANADIRLRGALTHLGTSFVDSVGQFFDFSIRSDTVAFIDQNVEKTEFMTEEVMSVVADLFSEQAETVQSEIGLSEPISVKSVSLFAGVVQMLALAFFGLTEASDAQSKEDEIVSQDEDAIAESSIRDQCDPAGLNQHAAGAKLDAGKSRAWLCLGGFAKAIGKVSEVTTFGAKKYTPGGWKSVPNAQERYLDAALRHLLATASEKADEESKLPHLAHAAWNLLAVLELQMLSAAQKEPVIA